MIIAKKLYQVGGFDNKPNKTKLQQLSMFCAVCTYQILQV
jgi:hypothetical protein